MGSKALGSVDLTSVQHVLWYVGDTNLGITPHSRQAALIHTIRCCVVDTSPAGQEYLEALRREFPAYVRAVETIVHGADIDPEPLRRYVKTRQPQLLDVIA